MEKKTEPVGAVVEVFHEEPHKVPAKNAQPPAPPKAAHPAEKGSGPVVSQPQTQLSPSAPVDEGPSDLAQWQEAAGLVIIQLQSIKTAKECAIIGLTRMEQTSQDVHNAPEVVQTIGNTPADLPDPTHILDDTTADLNMYAQLTCEAGKDKIQEQIVAIDQIVANLKLLDLAFQGKGEWSVNQAWAYLGVIRDYVHGERDKERTMRAFGYR